MATKKPPPPVLISARLDELFRTCDTNERGIIGPQEFQELCSRFGIGGEDATAIFLDLDHDGDGQIDFDDFSYGFRDFLTPGSRRGSLQIPINNNNGEIDHANNPNCLQAYHQQLEEMERKHKSARNAWKQFTNNVGIPHETTLRNGDHQLYEIVEEIRTENGPEVSIKLEKALSSLISDVQKLHEEYRSLETSFRKEREVHAQQLAALGEELDHQLAKTEAKAKAEAREEAQKQMDTERKKIATEMESQMADLSAQMRTFKKVEEWLSEETHREKRPEEAVKLIEAESENRNLKSALVEAQMKATVLQTQLTQKRNEYLDLVHEFQSEKVAASEYKNQVDLMQNHLSILSQANRVLSDANDCFSNAMPPHSTPSNSTAPNSLSLQQSISTPNSDDLQENNELPPQQVSEDSGRGTLLEELRGAESSPLPSGLWSTSTSPPPSKPKAFLQGVLAKGRDSLSTYTSFNENLDFGITNPPENLPPQRTFKVILAGDAAVGKTTFIERVCHGHFTPNLSSTIGVDFRVKSVELDGIAVALQLWDTAGQERFRSLTKSYFRRADGVILMYDVTNERTFLSIRHWIQNVEEGAGRKVPIVLCGNKSDLRERGSGCVTTEDGKNLSKQCGSLFMETSPKTGENVMQTLVILAREMSLVEDQELKNSLQLDLEDEKPKKGCCGGAAKS